MVNTRLPADEHVRRLDLTLLRTVGTHGDHEGIGSLTQ
jgi:hypothetical protein